MRYLPILYILLFVYACNSQGSKEEQNLEKRQYLKEANLVDILVLQAADFKKELVSNGRLKARKKSVLKCKVSEELIKVYFRNGDFVESIK